MNPCQKLGLILLPLPSPALLPYPVNLQVLSISLQIHSKYVSLLPCSLIYSSPSWDYQNGFLNNCPLPVLSCLIHSSGSNVPTLQQLLVISHMVKSKVLDTHNRALKYLLLAYLSCFLSYQNPPFTTLRPPWSSFNSPDLPISVPPQRYQTDPHLTGSVSVRSQRKCHFLREAFPDAPASTPLCYVPVLYSSYQHCNQLFL